jgi:hypothetical protein
MIAGGKKNDAGKLRWDLLPINQIEEVVKVLTHGSIEYGDENWKLVSNFRNRYYAATMRHLTAWRQGVILDSKTSLHHTAHAICSLIFLMWHDMEHLKDSNLPEELLKAAGKVKLLASIAVSPAKVGKQKNPRSLIKTSNNKSESRITPKRK